MKYILLRAAQLLRDYGWTTNELARTKSGFPCDPTSSQATCFCVEGAILKAAHEHHVESAPTFTTLREYLGYPTLFAWNDRQSDATPVIEALEQAAASFPQ